MAGGGDKAHRPGFWAISRDGAWRHGPQAAQRAGGPPVRQVLKDLGGGGAPAVCVGRRLGQHQLRDPGGSAGPGADLRGASCAHAGRLHQHGENTHPYQGAPVLRHCLPAQGDGAGSHRRPAAGGRGGCRRYYPHRGGAGHPDHSACGGARGRSELSKAAEAR